MKLVVKGNSCSLGGSREDFLGIIGLPEGEQGDTETFVAYFRDLYGDDLEVIIEEPTEG